MVYVVAFVLCLLIGAMGENRKIGFGWAFVISLFLSPLIGFIVVLLSPKLEKK